MNGNPGSPQPPGPKQRCTPETVATTVASYAIAFIRIAIWAVLAFLAGAFVYVAVRIVSWGVQAICKALGV